jgi:hypothetical protein
VLKKKTFQYEDKTLTVGPYEPKKTIDKSGIYISNLPVTITEDVLRNEYMSKIGKATKIYLFPSVDGATLNAAVLFDTELNDEVLDYNGAEIEGNTVHIRFLNSDDRKGCQSKLCVLTVV